MSEVPAAAWRQVSWSPTLTVPSLDATEVHVWCYPRSAPQELLGALSSLLDADERRRAGAFVFPELRDAYVATHGMLRQVLAGYLGTDPEALTFRRGRHGKPALAAPGGARGLGFNLSHSGGLVVCGISRGKELGVDIERIRPDRDVWGIARRYFSPAEVAQLRSIKRRRRVEAFYAGWTRKEAYIKARGVGLSQRLDSFDVALDPDRPAALLRAESAPDDVDCWAMAALPVPPGYAAAIAVELAEPENGARRRRGDGTAPTATLATRRIGPHPLVLLELGYGGPSPRSNVNGERSVPARAEGDRSRR
jgi:4'-phosphopantetheinyl transferase